MSVQKPQPSLHHQHTPSSSNRTSAAASSQISPNHASAYMLHGLQHSSVGTISPRQQQQQQPSPHHSQSHYSQQRSSHHNEVSRQPKEPISIQEFMKKNVNDFVSSSSKAGQVEEVLVSLDDAASQQLPVPLENCSVILFRPTILRLCSLSSDADPREKIPYIQSSDPVR